MKYSETLKADSLKDAMKAAINGPEKKTVKIYEHEFKVKQARVHTVGKQLYISGQLSHHLKRRPAHEIYYIITKQNGVINDIRMQINRSLLTELDDPIISSLGTYFEKAPIPSDKIEDIGKKIGTVINGRWKGAAEFIIVNIALRIN